MGFLTEAVQRVRKDLERRPSNDGTLLLRTRALPHPVDMKAALFRPDMALVAEVKRASPSTGPIAASDAGERVQAFARGGASAISVWTEPRYFDGSLADLRAARRKTALPILRKDLVISPTQVLEARAEGADAVLLMAAALSAAELEELGAVAAELGMQALVEVHSGKELEAAVDAGAQVIGVNARDPETLEVDFDGALALASRASADRPVVLEGGISSRRQVMRAEEAGVHAILVGEALMRSEDPARTIRKLLGRLG